VEQARKKAPNRKLSYWNGSHPKRFVRARDAFR